MSEALVSGGDYYENGSEIRQVENMLPDLEQRATNMHTKGTQAGCIES